MRSEVRSESGSYASPRRHWPFGFVTLWYQADDHFGLKLSVTYIDDDSQSYVLSSPRHSDKQCSSRPTLLTEPHSRLASPGALSEVQRWETEHNGLRHPSSVQVLTAWRALYGNQRDREGVLRAERLSPLPPPPATVLLGEGRAQHELRTGAEGCNYTSGIIPIAKAGVGLAPMVQGAGQEVAGASEGERLKCWLCGSMGEAHWPALPLEESSDDDACLPEAGSPAEDGVDSDSHVRDREGVRAGLGLDLTDYGEDDFVHKRNRRDNDDCVGTTRQSGGMTKRRRGSGSGVKVVGGASVGGRVEDDDVEVESSFPTANNKRQHKKTTRKSSSAADRNKRDTPSPSDVIRQLQKQVTVLETDLSATREVVRSKEKECAILVRKFDRRFAKEMETRRSWNAEKRVLEARILTLEGHSALMESRAVAAESYNQMIRDRIAPLHHLLGALEGGSFNGNMTPALPPGQYVQQQLPGHQHHPLSTGSGPASGRNADYVVPIERGRDSNEPTGSAFCVVCQDYTADTLVIPCGHLCVCNYHGVMMRAQGRLTKCPLCSKSSTGICRAVGL